MTLTTEGHKPGSPEASAVAYTLAVRKRALMHGAGRGTLAALASAVHPMTETGALPFIEPRLDGLSPAQRIGVRRTVGMIALHKKVRDLSEIAAPEAEGTEPGTDPLKRVRRSTGESLRLLHFAEHRSWPGEMDAKGSLKRTSMTTAIDGLPLLDIENASVVLSGLIGRCGNSGIAVDFTHLARTLARWGDGMTEHSRATRLRLVQDFYSAHNILNTDQAS